MEIYGSMFIKNFSFLLHNNENFFGTLCALFKDNFKYYYKTFISF